LLHAQIALTFDRDVERILRAEHVALAERTAGGARLDAETDLQRRR